MKKTVKSLLVVMLMLVVALSVAGCGKKDDEKESSKKNVVTISKTEDEYTEKAEVTFKDDKIESVTIKMTMATEDEAKEQVDSFNLVLSMAEDEEMKKQLEEEVGIKSVKQDGKDIVMELTPKGFESVADDIFEDKGVDKMTKSDFEKAAKDAGYDVK